MKNSKRSVTANIEFLVKKVWKWDKKLFFYFGLYTIVTAIVPFINIFALKFLLDELMGANRGERLITILLSYVLYLLH